MIIENKACGLGRYYLIPYVEYWMGTKNYTTHTVFFQQKRVAAGKDCGIESTQISVLVDGITSGAKVSFSDLQYKIAHIY